MSQPLLDARGVVEACQQSIHAHPSCMLMFLPKRSCSELQIAAPTLVFRPLPRTSPCPSQGSPLLMETSIFDEGHSVVSAIMRACFRENKSTLLSPQSELKDRGRRDTPLHEGQQNWLWKIRLLSHRTECQRRARQLRPWIRRTASPQPAAGCITLAFCPFAVVLVLVWCAFPARLHQICPPRIRIMVALCQPRRKCRLPILVWLAKLLHSLTQH